MLSGEDFGHYSSWARSPSPSDEHDMDLLVTNPNNSLMQSRTSNDHLRKAPKFEIPSPVLSSSSSPSSESEGSVSDEADNFCQGLELMALAAESLKVANNNNQAPALKKTSNQNNVKPQTAPGTKPKKTQVRVACTNCKKAHIACDLTRPCRRCHMLGKECIDVQHKRRGRPPNANKLTRSASMGLPPLNTKTSMTSTMGPASASAKLQYTSVNSPIALSSCESGPKSALPNLFSSSTPPPLSAISTEAPAVSSVTAPNSQSTTPPSGTFTKHQPFTDGVNVYLLPNGIIAKASSDVLQIWGKEPSFLVGTPFQNWVPNSTSLSLLHHSSDHTTPGSFLQHHTHHIYQQQQQQQHYHQRQESPSFTYTVASASPSSPALSSSQNTLTHNSANSSTSSSPKSTSNNNNNHRFLSIAPLSTTAASGTTGTRQVVQVWNYNLVKSVAFQLFLKPVEMVEIVNNVRVVEKYVMATFVRQL